MILEFGLVKAIAAGGGLVSCIALIAGMTGGGQYATAQADPMQLASAVCAYTRNGPDSSTSTRSHTSASGSRELTSKQAANARIIINTAKKLGLPRRAGVIAVATALQESSLRGETVGDHGRAFGIFQQHPGSGWGTRAQVSNPRYAARAFFSRLIKIRNWSEKPLTVVAQAIQRSDFPTTYARHEARAKRIVAELGWAKSRTSQKAHDTVELSVADARAVRGSLELATSLGVSRATFVADIDMALSAGRLRSAQKYLKNKGDRSKLADKIVETVARSVCAELSQKIGQVLDPATLEVIRRSGRGGVALEAALTMIGVPYSWGGGGSNGASFGIGRGAGTKGFDCSGLAEYAWAKAGIRIGGNTSAQWQAGTHISRSQLRPGDLVFFATNPKNPSTIHHVVMNIDGKRYVHAPHTGSKVQVGRWTATREAEYAGAVRPG
ncbi:C40 family peptidase [Nonomuraea sp. NEAU-A123]|uniref:C40 family peptidase n=1 Tax=Nonomuraea sp. NEAU-A123 TaxID=2839649 RepID=UPI002032E0FF|nr:NlpC/P60 family protein [Nonomuraea sp. NEAU-A123]